MLGVGTNLQLYLYKTLLSQNFVKIFFDRYAKTWQGEHCMQCHIKVLLLYIFFPTYNWSMTKLKYDVTVERV